MQALDSSFAGERYVSDVLERWLGAADTRRCVRAFCLGLLERTSQALRSRVEPVAHYVGGKCMGYPAIWFLERLLAQTPERIVARCRAPLCISLSTSIVDDLADADEQMGPEYLAYLYVLIGEAVGAGVADAAVLERLYHAIDVCLDPNVAKGADYAAARGDRIGRFFALIAAVAVEGELEASRAAVAIETTARFGEICGHIDDWMDAGRDLDRDAIENIALTLLRDRLEGRVPRRVDLVLHQPWLQQRMMSLLSERVADAVALANSAGFVVAARALTDLLERCQDSQRSM